MMKEECYAALGHILTCNKNKEPQMHEVVKWRDTERERERERERIKFKSPIINSYRAPT
jgi:hypothetical protein